MKFGFYFIILLLICFWIAPAPAAISDEIVFIVNSENPATEISRKELTDYYFKKKRQWPDGTSVRFIDKGPDSPARKIFLQKIVRQSSEDVELLWIGQKLYSGESAPLQETADSMTMQFVGAFKGAIGYLPASATTASKRVKVIKLKHEEND